MTYKQPQMHRLFPVNVYQGQLETPQTDIVFKYATYAPDAGKSNSVTTDAVGDSHYHLNDEFDPLFEQIKHAVYAYLQFKYDTSKFDLYVIKSWIVDFGRADNTIHRHNHPHADISIIYYADISDSPLKFESHDPTQLFTIMPNKNDLLVFPSSLVHRVDRQSVHHRRVALSADIIMVLKPNVISYEFARNPIHTWKKI